jgi:hypothetical protein
MIVNGLLDDAIAGGGTGDSQSGFSSLAALPVFNGLDDPGLRLIPNIFSGAVRFGTCLRRDCGDAA